MRFKNAHVFRRQLLTRSILSFAALATFVALVPSLGAESAPVFVTQWGTLGSGNGQFHQPTGIAVDRWGNVYVADASNNRVEKFATNGTFLKQWGSFGTGNGQFSTPQGVAADRFGNVYVVDYGNNRIEKFSADGVYATQWGSFGSGNSQFKQPLGVAADLAGNVYVADFNNSRIQKFDSTGAYLTQWATAGAAGVALDPAGNVYVTDGATSVQKFSSAGVLITAWGSPGTGNGQFNHPLGIAVDSGSNVFVADMNNTRVQKFTGTGAYVSQFGTAGAGAGQFNQPEYVAVDPIGNIYVTDTSTNRVERFAPGSGTFLTIDYPGALYTNVSGVNHFGQMVGYYLPDAFNDIVPGQTGYPWEKSFILSDFGFNILPNIRPMGTFATGFNNNGLVTGYYTAFLEQTEGFIWNANTGQFTTYHPAGISVHSPPPDGPLFYIDTSSVLSGVNEMGQFVGSYTLIYGQLQDFGFLGFGNTLQPLSYPGAFGTRPLAISGASGISPTRIVGSYINTYGGPRQGFLWSWGGFAPVSVSGATSTVPRGIYAMNSNSSIRIVGSYTDLGGQTHGFRQDGYNGPVTTIDYPGATSTYANSINDAGVIVGTFFDSGGNRHGFRLIP